MNLLLHDEYGARFARTHWDLLILINRQYKIVLENSFGFLKHVLYMEYLCPDYGESTKRGSTAITFSVRWGEGEEMWVCEKVITFSFVKT